MVKSRVEALSAHFRVEEFDCHNGERVPGLALDALRAWCVAWGEPLRKRFGPVTVTSGFRPGPYNRAVGGVPGSLHVYNAVESGRYRAQRQGVAADVHCRDGSVNDWAAWALARSGVTVPGLGAGRGGVGRYPSQGFVHLDTGSRRTWAG